MDKIAAWCVQSISISKRIQDTVGKKLTDFIDAIKSDSEIKEVSREI